MQIIHKRGSCLLGVRHNASDKKRLGTIQPSALRKCVIFRIEYAIQESSLNEGDFVSVELYPLVNRGGKIVPFHT
jgi:hypothetical protein